MILAESLDPSKNVLERPLIVTSASNRVVFVDSVVFIQFKRNIKDTRFNRRIYCKLYIEPKISTNRRRKKYYNIRCIKKSTKNKCK